VTHNRCIRSERNKEWGGGGEGGCIPAVQGEWVKQNWAHKEKSVEGTASTECQDTHINAKSYLYDHPSLLCCPDAHSLVGDLLSGNGCGSPNHI